MGSPVGAGDSGLRYRNGIAVFALVLVALLWLGANLAAQRDLYFLGAALLSLLVALAAFWLRRSDARQRCSALALREREMQLLDAQELAGMVSLEWIVDEDRVIWSRPVEFLLGPKPEGGYPLFREMVHPDDRDLWLDERQCALDNGAAGRYTDYRLIRTDGALRWISCSQRVEIDAATGARRQVAILLDITERKLAEQALAAHELELVDLTQNLERRVAGRTSEIHTAVSLLTATLEATADGILVVDLERRITRFNQRYRDQWSIPPGLLEGGDYWGQRQAVLDQVADPEQFVAVSDRLYAQPLSTLSDIIRFKDGRIFERYSQPQMVDGVPVGRVWSMRDVTEKLRVADALRAADERYRRVVANMVEGVVLRDAAGRIVDCNASAERMLGISLAETRGGLSVTGTGGGWKVVNEHGVPVPEDQRSALLALRTGEPRANMVLGYQKPDGTMLWLSSTSQPLFEDGGGKPSGVFTTFIDITARKLAEDARDSLESQLRESQKMEAMGTLAGGIAHDFNNLLAIILGNAALVNAEIDAGHPAAAGVAEINRAGYRAKHLVEQILTFSRKQPPNFVELALRPVIENTLGLLRSTLPAGVRLETRFDTEPLHVRADGTQIGQVLMNLCTNAWHAMTLNGSGSGSAEAGAPAGHLTIGLARLEIGEAAGVQLETRFGAIAPGRYAHLTVGDEGVGMDADTQLRIFEPFYTTKPFGQGTGLGLSVVHGIVKAHGGGIAVTSSPGAGTTMEIVLPLIAVPLAVAATPAGAPAPGQGSGQEVLYLDDEPSMVYLVKRMLERSGYRVSGFEAPAEALAALRADARRFDIVVTDFNMPGMSGLDVARQVREINPDLPVVITSGYISEELRSNAGLIGVRHVIYKPNTVEELCQSIAQVLHRPAG